MVDLALDLNPASSHYKDFLLINNDLALTSDAQPGSTNNILQSIIQRLSFFLGEWFLNNTEGVPWFQQILVKGPNQSAIDGILKNVILGTLGVTGLSSYSFTPNLTGRTLAVTFSVTTTSGPVDYSGTISASSSTSSAGNSQL
jgi:hypothetical protein